MTVTITGKYVGNKRVELHHGPSGAMILTDAPKDNNGEGAAFSPTDLLAGALGSCMMTIMAIMAEREGTDLSGMHMTVEKSMVADPRRIGSLPVTIHMPAVLEEGERKRLEAGAKVCPVDHSLSDQIDVTIQFVYDV